MTFLAGVAHRLLPIKNVKTIEVLTNNSELIRPELINYLKQTYQILVNINLKNTVDEYRSYLTGETSQDYIILTDHEILKQLDKENLLSNLKPYTKAQVFPDFNISVTNSLPTFWKINNKKIHIVSIGVRKASFYSKEISQFIKVFLSHEYQKYLLENTEYSTTLKEFEKENIPKHKQASYIRSISLINKD